jgi:hypothetical protein
LGQCTIDISWIIQINPQYPARRKRQDKHIVSDLGSYEVRSYREIEGDSFDVEQREGVIVEVLEATLGDVAA